MKIRRTLPPAAAPLNARCLLSGLAGMLRPEKHLARLEQEIKNAYHVRHVYFLSSGKAALTLILEALKSLAPAKNSVLIPAYTCFSVPSAIVKAGLDVALCDIDPLRFDYDPAQLPGSIGPDTLCVIADHLFGIPADVEAIAALRRSNDFFVVEDAAQAMGGTDRGKKLGTIGDVGFFSLGRGKNITAGSGGIIITNDDRIAAAIGKNYATLPAPGMGENVTDLVKALALSWFMHPSLYWFPAGLPGLRLGETLFESDFPVKKMSGLKAGLMKNWQSRLEASNQKRKENSLTFCISGDNEKKCSSPAAFLRFPVLAASREMRDQMYRTLVRKGLGTSRMYPTAINQVSELRDRFRGVSFPSAEAVAARILTLPTHELVSARDRQEILLALGECMEPMGPAPAEAAAGSVRSVSGGLVHS
jgi:perosamine synthetase